MTAKAKKTPATKPVREARLEQERRFARAEQACRTLMTVFAELESSGAFDLHDTTRQYLQMSRVHYRKIRNGKVISPTDFNAAVDVCTSVRRALLALDSALRFDGRDNTSQLLELLAQADAVLADYRQLKQGGAKA